MLTVTDACCALQCCAELCGLLDWSESFDLDCDLIEAMLSWILVRTRCDTVESPWELICGLLPHQQTIHRLEPLTLLCRHLASPTQLSSSCSILEDFPVIANSLLPNLAQIRQCKPRLTFQTQTQQGLGLGQLLQDRMVLARHCGVEHLQPALCKERWAMFRQNIQTSATCFTHG